MWKTGVRSLLSCTRSRIVTLRSGTREVGTERHSGGGYPNAEISWFLKIPNHEGAMHYSRLTN